MRALVVTLFLGGCITHGGYRVTRADLDARTPTLPATRDEGVPVQLVRAAIDPVDLLPPQALPGAIAPPASDGRVHVSASARNRTVAAGVVLTLVGSLLSVVGTSTWLALRGGPHGDVADGFFAVELAGEPLMVAGTVLWILGLVHPAQEAW